MRQITSYSGRLPHLGDIKMKKSEGKVIEPQEMYVSAQMDRLNKSDFICLLIWSDRSLVFY